MRVVSLCSKSGSPLHHHQVQGTRWAIDKMARNNEWLYDLGGQKQGNAIMLMAHQSFVQVM